MLLGLVYLGNLLFALTYNVGDTHVFLLPSHLAVALFAACGVAALQRVLSGFVVPRWREIAAAAVAAIAIGAGAVRVWHEYSALDRSHDARPTSTIEALTDGLDDRRDVLVADLNWQLENGLTYFGRNIGTNVAWTTASSVAPHAPAFIGDNLVVGRRIVTNERGKDSLERARSALGAEVAVDETSANPTLIEATRDLPPGTRYVLCVLKPTREFSVDAKELDVALRQLTGGKPAGLGDVQRNYAAVAGQVGREAAWHAASDVPFRASIPLDGAPTEVRMESWLAFDTIRRMGFGQVVVARQHTLIVERGVSFVAFGLDGLPLRLAYAANIFAKQRRYGLVPKPRG
jgi:hypothetical protein